MPDLTKPPTPDQLEAWPPLTPEDIYLIEDMSIDEISSAFKGDMESTKNFARLRANEIAVIWPRIVTTAMLLWQFQKKADGG